MSDKGSMMRAAIKYMAAKPKNKTNLKRLKMKLHEFANIYQCRPHIHKYTEKDCR